VSYVFKMTIFAGLQAPENSTMISQVTIDKIIDTARIEDVVQDFVPLKRRGVNLIGLCPFHKEKTPSFNVSPSKGIFKCFGCGKGGNAVNFIMEHEQLDWISAIKYLAKKYRIEIEDRELTEEEKKLGSERESMLIVSAFAQKFFSRILNESEEGIAIGLSYFRERGFNDTIIEKFQLGYCPEGKSIFTDEALKNGYKLEFLEKTGLSVVKDTHNYFDRFSGRVMFPVFSISGRVIAFGGRTLKSDKNIAKYLNSPESAIYHKSQTLYGLYQAKTAIQQNDKCILVEGYTDVLALHQAGIENVVASSGTSLTKDQIQIIRRFTANVTILYDGDPAGIKASLRGIDMLLEEGLNIKILLLPDNHDPDSFAKKHNYSFLVDYFKQHEQDFIHFKSKLLSDEAKNDPVKRTYMISDIVRTISVIDDSIKRTVYLQECSRLLKIPEHTLFQETAKYRRKNIEDKRKAEERAHLPESVPIAPPVPSFINEELYCEPYEKELIRLMLLYGEHSIFENLGDEAYDEPHSTIKISEYIINEIKNDELEFKNLKYRKVFLHAEELIFRGITPTVEMFINNKDPEISKVAADVCSPGYQLSAIWAKHHLNVEPEERHLDQVVPRVLVSYKRRIMEQHREEAIKRLQELQHNPASETGEIENIQLRLTQLNSLINKCARLYNCVVIK